MKINGIKKLAIALVALPVLTVALLNSASVQIVAADAPDAAATFTAKCKMCHGLKAEKHFDVTKPEDEMVEAILKGKKAEKPPNMPAYEEKGIDADQAKALITYMKSLKQ